MLFQNFICWSLLVAESKIISDMSKIFERKCFLLLVSACASLPGYNCSHTEKHKHLNMKALERNLEASASLFGFSYYNSQVDCEVHGNLLVFLTLCNGRTLDWVRNPSCRIETAGC